MRERLAKDKGATYTYSMDYVSQTVSLVDEFRVKENQEVGTDTDGLDRRMQVAPPNLKVAHCAHRGHVYLP